MEEKVMDNKNDVAISQTKEYHEMLWDRNPWLKEASREVEEAMMSEMIRFGLMDNKTQDQYGHLNHPFICVYQSERQVEFEDPTMIRLVWYNISVALIKHQQKRVSLTSTIALGELRDTDLHLALFRNSLKNIRVVHGCPDLGDATDHGIWNEDHHADPKFNDCQGSDYLTFFTKSNIQLQDIPPEAILYITREVEVKHYLDHDKNEVEEIVDVLINHASLLADIESEKQKLEIKIQAISKQQHSLQTLYPPNSLTEWQQRLEKLTRVEIERQQLKIAQVIEEEDQKLQKELAKFDEDLEQEKQAFLATLESRRKFAVQFRTPVKDEVVKKNIKPFEEEIQKLENSLKKTRSFSVT